MKIGLSILNDHLPELQHAIAELGANTVSVGVADTPRDDSELTNADLAYIQEYGEPAQNLPARPALAQGMEAALPATGAALEDGLRAALDGDAGGVRRALNRAGVLAAEGVRKEYQHGAFQPLSEARARERQRAGTGTQPLYDTHQTANAVEFEIVEEH